MRGGIRVNSDLFFPLEFSDLESQVQSGTLLKNKKTTPIFEWVWLYFVPIPYRLREKYLVNSEQRGP